MTQVRPLLLAATLALALPACDQRPPEALEDVPAEGADAAGASTGAATGAPVAAPPSVPSEDLEQVTVAADAVRVGTAVGPDGAATAPKPVYALSDVVYASARANGAAKVYWTYQDGTSHKEEEKPANGIVTFQFGRADGMQAGAYSVEIDIDGVPVGITDFVVK